jgi:hypothetical protein
MFTQSSRNLDSQEIKSKAIERKRSQIEKADSSNALNALNYDNSKEALSDDSVFWFVPKVIFRKDDIQNRTVSTPSALCYRADYY